jgi:outer membrane protein OmpA-like peptidoglycan-associated protein
MKGFYTYIYLFILILGVSLPSVAQKSAKKMADKMYQAGKYKEALVGYQKYKKTNKDPQLLVKRGYCYLENRQVDECIKDMAAAHKLKSLNNQRFKYMAQAYQYKGDYIEAAKMYKVYLETLESDSPEWYKTIHEIKKCAYGINQVFSNQIAYVENLGQNINTEFDDFGAVQSPTQQERYYFSSARESATGGLRNTAGLEDDVTGKYYSDMYVVDLKDGKWSSVLPFEHVLNTNQHDVLQDFSTDGTVMYFVQSPDLKYGTIYADSFKVERDINTLPTTASLPFNSELGDKNLHIFNDSLIIFASTQYNGFGGYDIYYCFRKNNLWSQPQNMGSGVNSKFNDESPFLTKNGQILYFATDRIETFGGLDLYSSKYDKTKSKWVDVKNMGIPINSPNDDTDFELASDGLNAIISSDRMGTLGKNDLYIAYFKDQILDQLDFIDLPYFAVNSYQNFTTDTTLITVNNDSLLTEISIEVNIPPVKKEEEVILPQRDFISKPLYFKDSEDVANTLNQVQIKKVLDIMKVYPEIKVVLTSHFTPESRPDFDLYFSVKRAEKISSILVANDINPARILILGCGPNYPIALHEINGKESTLAIKTNRRIDINFYNLLPRLNIKVITETPIVADMFRDDKWDEFDIRNQGLTFRVKFATVNQMLKSEVFNIRKDGIIEKIANSEDYTYFFGNESTYASAREVKSQIAKIESKQELEIIPYLFGVPLTRSEMLQYNTIYPELHTYMRQEGILEK